MEVAQYVPYSSIIGEIIYYIVDRSVVQLTTSWVILISVFVLIGHVSNGLPRDSDH